MKFLDRLCCTLRLTAFCGFGIVLLLTFSSTAFAQLPTPTQGWNLGNTMEPPSGVGTWGGTPTKALINSVANVGFNTVRIPCAWDSHADKTTHQIDPAYMAQVKQVVDWCYTKHLYVIINDHWDGGWLENHITDTVDPAINAKMKAYWAQIATAFDGYDNHLLFAAANEPAAKTPAQVSTLLTYYQTFVDTVRRTGEKNKSRWLVIQGPGAANIDVTCSLMNPLPIDPTPGRLMIEVHYYDPYQFSDMSKDASWGKMFYFWGKGYHSTIMTSRNATWGEEYSVASQFQKIHDKFIAEGIPVLLGEYRATPKRDNPDLTGTLAQLNTASTTYWNKRVHDAAIHQGLYPCCWDTPGQTFDWNTGAVKDQNALNALLGKSCLPPPDGGI